VILKIFRELIVLFPEMRRRVRRPAPLEEVTRNPSGEGLAVR
jgi:hypothetical protein